MSKITVTELRRNLSECLSRARASEIVEVTVRGRVIARIVSGTDVAREARAFLKTVRRKARVGDVSSPTGARWNAERGRC
jgi:prevent-host-death family protein